LVKLNNYLKAIGHYDWAIEIDHNEYAISNKVLCLNKVKDYKNAIANAGEGLKKIAKFNAGSAAGTKEEESTLLLLKLHYRKAKAHEELAEFV
jgi:tetratricopeptide (TPR) repeat protein